MKTQNFQIIILLILGIILFTSCNSFASSDPVTAQVTNTLETAPHRENSPTPTPYPVCTPPPCAENESYFCPAECIGGCGTTCATHTPEPILKSPAATDQPAHTATPVRFAVIGDYGLAGEAEAEVANLIKTWAPDFIITVGDNNYPHGAAETIDENVGQYYHEYIYPYSGTYGAGAEENRFFPTLGNHDWTNLQAYLDYFTLPGNERYYDFVWGPVHFFALDGDSREPDGVGRSSIQAAWLRDGLAASESPWKIVYMHQPPYTSSIENTVDWMRWPYKEWGADVVISGHQHAYERLLIDGLPYFVNGLGGGERYAFDDPYPGSQVRYRADYGALFVEASETTLSFVFETRSAEIIDAYLIEKQPQDNQLPVAVQEFPNPENFQWQQFVAGLDSPVGLTHAGDDSNRLFIIEQNGRIRIIQEGALQPTPFLDIRERVDDGSNEQGLLGLAFHPEYVHNGYFYLNYTGKGGDTFISRFQVTDDKNLADRGSEKILLSIRQPYGNHNGGQLVFGPDGYLYIGTGDGGSANDPHGNAQSLNTLLGKILRIDVDHADPYGVPADNPFVGVEGRSEIWAYGLRNPWRFSFDRLTGDLYLGDVGQNQWEEINFLDVTAPAGANFGWDFWEGFHLFEGSPPQNLEFVSPIWEYDHSLGCSVTGGIVYRGPLDAWQGVYFYGDFCTGIVWGLLQDEAGAWQSRQLFQTSANITSFGEDQDGEIYLVDRKGIVWVLSER